ncbi:MaoC family dehydratase [Microbispora cellulosiformans]|uniref:MaoC family dehydratase n=1 Tax=Microbispora cellulosiformans TaxID=2614688 RepID=A0A5J5K7N3_9ACTN|nr:MaoC family dehydratase [Microbispora cellulosiformans]KAA9379704.1 MaoC family dehydratase [Microbispora cellulosiformans]
MRAFANVEELKAAAGETFGPGEWRPVTQQQVNMFADATGDHQRIHVDAARVANGPFGSAIAHGFMSLALLPVLMGDLLHVGGVVAAVNHGMNKVRFPAPVPVGSRVRASAELLDVKGAPPGASPSWASPWRWRAGSGRCASPGG